MSCHRVWGIDNFFTSCWYDSVYESQYYVTLYEGELSVRGFSAVSMRAAYKAAWHQYRLFRYEQRLEA